MIGLLITLVFSFACAGLGRALLSRWLADCDPAAGLGMSGLAGLGLVGTISLFIGLLPGGTQFGLYVVGALGVAGLAMVARNGKSLGFKMAQGPHFPFVCVLFVAVAIPLVGSLVPSTMLDWDSLAYHLAVPKLWIAAGRMASIPFIHQSNFPQAIDDLYVWGLQWGGQPGAKTFNVAILIYGLLATFGLARQEYGETAGWWATLGVASVPLIVWESGTAYIDIGHGFYAGLGLFFAGKLGRDLSDKRWFWLSAMFLSLAAGSKYTGLQTIFVASAVVAVCSLAARRSSGVKTAVLLGFASVLLCSPWYIRNEVWKGNPVFPFFYSKLGGKDWSQERADVYTHEQNTFGVGRMPEDAQHPDIARNPLQPGRLGHAVLGLAYQPGRYINPGQTKGEGAPVGAIGVALLAAMLAWMFSGKMKALEYALVGGCLLTLLMWFGLSQQSRYVLSLVVPLSTLLGGGVVRLKVGSLLAGVAALQSVFCVWLVESMVVTMQMPALMGSVTPDEFQTRTIPFFTASKSINALGPSSKTALYDEVFGFLLDVPYVWANPGHSVLIPYESMSDGADYAEKMKELGFTHVFVSLSPVVAPPDQAARWLAAAGLKGSQPYSEAERKALTSDFEQKWRFLVADAARVGRLRPVAGSERWVLFEIQ